METPYKPCKTEMELKKTTPPFSSVPSPFLYWVCIEFRTAVSASVWIKFQFLKLESVRPKNWYGLDLSRCQIASAVSLLYRTMHCTTFHRLEGLSSHRVNRGTLCGYCFPQLIKICLTRIPLPRCLDPSRHITLPPDNTVLIIKWKLTLKVLMGNRKFQGQ